MNSFTWTTACIYWETTDTLTIVFDQGEDMFSFKAGQFINLSLMINNEKVTRAYSLSSCPGEDERPAITIKQVDEGLMSTYILNHAEEIKEWKVDGPHGFFHPTDATLNSKWVVLIGGGSGITPLYSILKYLLRSTDTNILLINSNKTAEDIIFEKALMYMQQSFSHRLQIVQIFTKQLPADTSAWKEAIEGRLTRIRLKKIIKQYTGEEYNKTHYFMCGPNGILQLATDTLQSLEVPSTQIFKETFQPIDNDVVVDLPLTTQEVLLHHYDRSNLLEIVPGKTILEAALEDHVPVQYSCKNGTCGICIGKLTSGNVHMKQNYALQQEQLEQGYVLLCQAHPLDNNVTIKVGDW
jgi:ferredoxin-NADP reductase